MQVVNVSNRFYKVVYLEQSLNWYQFKIVLFWDWWRMATPGTTEQNE